MMTTRSMIKEANKDEFGEDFTDENKNDKYGNGFMDDNEDVGQRGRIRFYIFVNLFKYIWFISIYILFIFS